MNLQWDIISYYYYYSKRHWLSRVQSDWRLNICLQYNRTTVCDEWEKRETRSKWVHNRLRFGFRFFSLPILNACFLRFCTVFTCEWYLFFPFKPVYFGVSSCSVFFNEFLIQIIKTMRFFFSLLVQKSHVTFINGESCDFSICFIDEIISSSKWNLISENSCDYEPISVMINSPHSYSNRATESGEF